jgi:hypothetical protein
VQLNIKKYTYCDSGVQTQDVQKIIQKWKTNRLTVFAFILIKFHCLEFHFSAWFEAKLDKNFSLSIIYVTDHRLSPHFNHCHIQEEKIQCCLIIFSYYIFQAFPDVFTERELYGLHLDCANLECHWSGTYGDKEVRIRGLSLKRPFTPIFLLRLSPFDECEWVES